MSFVASLSFFSTLCIFPGFTFISFILTLLTVFPIMQKALTFDNICHFMVVDEFSIPLLTVDMFGLWSDAFFRSHRNLLLQSFIAEKMRIPHPLRNNCLI